MFLKALGIAILYYVVLWVGNMGGVFHFSRPIIVGPLVGLLLGDLHTGIVLGATFESVFLGVIAVGGAVPADATIGSLMGTAVAILTHVSGAKALAVAVPVSALGVILMQITYAYMALFIPKLDILAKRGDEKGVIRYNFIMSFVYPILNTIVIFFSIFLGVNAVGDLLKIIPKFVQDGFTAAGAMLPAVGFAMLLNMLFKGKLFGYFFLGFALVVYLKLPNLGVAIIAIVIALMIYDIEQKFMANKNSSSNSDVNNGNVQKLSSKRTEEEDFLS
ncbi:PTS mannose/fructose/sorbose/N-acetylgalactosamine transporter subunit IIC [Xylocopilactobacillus apis]|uniref:PTS acetylgalactosamine transporter subunit IIC n=1 Tax=Xylocopilactobacillus apis TaxID=2932183 RepID=A0AAU9DL12_9LACO|nr:PTS sugar transporter subunit IIC [Xylocopilactobacillus apis]BDR55463.1 PTS acetylgalactosamine transporter subunit IIC [Xylocopilactobacillus apis]